MDTYLLFGWGALIIFLLIRLGYLDQRLKTHIDRHYPEEGRVIRSYEWQWYPWSVGRKTLRAVVKNQGPGDPKLAHLAKKAKRAQIYFIALPLIMFFVFSSGDLYNALTRLK